MDLEPYVAAMKKVAEEKKVPLVVLHARSHELIEKLGPDGVIEMEPDGKTPAPTMARTSTNAAAK